MNRESHTAILMFFAFWASLATGLFYFNLTTNSEPQLPPLPLTIRAAAPPVERDLVIGLSEVLVEIHAEAKATKTELEGVKAEARTIIGTMIEEIQRLQKRPTIQPQGEATVLVP